MKTTLIEGRHYKAISRWRGTLDFFKAGEVSHGGDCIWLSFPPEAGKAIGRGGYHWPPNPFMADYSLIRENTAVELTMEELLQVIQETGWQTTSKIHGIDNWNGQMVDIRDALAVSCK